ncbi:MAG: hypothetical protein WC319_10235 [Candidatus Paceibacterota bacterium]|jgi:hypothetical protein
MKIGWQVGPHEWAFKYLAEHLIKALPDFEHVMNKPGDIDILLAVDSLIHYKTLSDAIAHIDGNRWHSHGDFKSCV